MRCAMEFEACVEKRNAYNFWWRRFKVRDRLENLGVDGSVVLKWILNK